MEVGFTVVGKQIGEALIRKNNLRPGDKLYLNKPIGTGMLMAAHMRSVCSAVAYVSLIDWMLMRQHQLARIAVDCGVVAGTDITGFGLAGHLIEMLDASEVSASIQLSEVPLLVGLEECWSQGIESSLAPANRHFEQQMDAATIVRQADAYQMLFDPQTCGGIVFGVSEQNADPFCQAVEDAGLPRPICIGWVLQKGQQAQAARLSVSE